MDFVSCDDLKIICKRCSDDLCSIKIISHFFLLKMKMSNDRLENCQQNYRAEGISLKAAFPETERLRCLFLGDDFSFKFGVEIGDVVDEVVGNIVVFQADGDEVVRHGSISICKVIHGDVHSFVICFGMLNYFLQILS